MKKFLLTMLLVAAMCGMAFGGEITLSSAVYTDNGGDIGLLAIDTDREVEFTFTITSFPLPLYFYAAVSTTGGLHSYGATMNNTLRPISISKEFGSGESGMVSLRIYDRIGGDLLGEESVAIAAKGETPDPSPSNGGGSGGCNSGFATISLLASLLIMGLEGKKRH